MGASRLGDGPAVDRVALSISYLTCTLSRLKKNGSPEPNSGEVTAWGRGWASPAASSAWRRLSLLITITSAATIRANYMRVKHLLAPVQQLGSYAMRLFLNYKIL